MTKKNKNTIYILYSLFLTENGEKIVIGGIQKYILGLINVFSKNYHIKIIQRSSYNFYKKYDTYQVLGFQVKGNKNLGKQLYKNIENSLNPSDYVIWASDRVSFKISHKKTIVMIAHRLTTVKECDVIFMLDKGKITDKGKYDELLALNEKFRNMASV